MWALWFDSYLNYPYSLRLTWPPLFDLLSAAVSLMQGQRSQQGVAMASAFLPAVLRALTIMIVYYIVKESINNDVARLSAIMVAIAPYHINKTPARRHRSSLPRDSAGDGRTPVYGAGTLPKR